MIGRVSEGGAIPWWAGVAWYDYQSMTTVYAPIGLALALGLARWCYHALQCPISQHEWDRLRMTVAILERGKISNLDEIDQVKKERDAWRNLSHVTIAHLKEGHGCGAFTGRIDISDLMPAPGEKIH